MTFSEFEIKYHGTNCGAPETYKFLEATFGLTRKEAEILIRGTGTVDLRVDETRLRKMHTLLIAKVNKQDISQKLDEFKAWERHNNKYWEKGIFTEATG